MLRIGLTGGIGSGKTVVSDRFRHLGVPVIDTDEIAHSLTTRNSAAVREIEREFGPHVIRDGELDRNALREQVFSDAGARHKLEAILHPRIREEVTRRIRALDAPYCLIVVPLMVESGFQDLIDRVLVVEAPTEKRRQWLAERNGFSHTDIQRIFSAQASDAERAAIADDLIRNDNDIAGLVRRVDDLHRCYTALAD
jgi:dephospho-CoA kinase